MPPLPTHAARKQRSLLPTSTRAGLALLASAIVACSEPEPPHTVRMLDLAAAPTTGSYEPAASRTAPVQLRGADLEWTALPSPERHAGEEELALFRKFAKQTDSGALELGAAPGAWAAVFPVEPNTDLRITAAAALTGLSPGPGYRTARLLAVSFREAPESLELDDMLAAELDRTWGSSLEGDGVTRKAELILRTHSEARSVGLFLFLAMNKPFENTRVSWTEVEVQAATPWDHLRAASEEPIGVKSETDIPVGAFIIGETFRPSIALLPGDRASVEVVLPEGESRFEAWLGIPPYAYSPEGARASLRVDLRRKGVDASEARLLVESEVENELDAPTRWHPVRVDLPTELAGQAVTLRFLAQSETDCPVVLALGNPRIVPAHPARVGPNVVLISLDTVRADRLGSYGGPAINSPSIDALASESLLFENAWSAAPYTLPSHVSMFSGQLPSVHGVQRPGNRIDSERTTLLATYLLDRGYATGAFTGGGYVHPNFGFATGFESYGTIDPVSNLDSLAIQEGARTNALRSLDLIRDSDMNAVEAWLEAHANESFLLFFHSYIAHQFDPSPEAAAAIGVKPLLPEDQPTTHLLFSHANPGEAERARLLELYDASIRQADTAIGRLMAALRELELLDDTIVVLTSDHGKEIGEHGRIDHGHSLHRELVNVPLLLRIPGQAPGRRAAPVSGVDIFPTLLELLDLPLPRRTPLQGTSLLTAPPTRPVFAEVDSIHSGIALREGDLKTIVMIKNHDWAAGGVEETYDVERDPFEHDPLEPDAARQKRALDFGRALRALGESLGGSEQNRRTLDPETKAQLEGLGYTVGAAD